MNYSSVQASWQENGTKGCARYVVCIVQKVSIIVLLAFCTGLHSFAALASSSVFSKEKSQPLHGISRYAEYVVFSVGDYIIDTVGDYVIDTLIEGALSIQTAASSVTVGSDVEIRNGITIQGFDNIVKVNNAIIQEGITFAEGYNTLYVRGMNTTIKPITNLGTVIIKGSSGRDIVEISEAILSGTIDLGEGSNTMKTSNATVDDIVLGSWQDLVRIENNSTVRGSIHTKGGGDIVYVYNSVIQGSIITSENGLPNNDTVKMQNSSLIGSLLLDKGSDTVVLNGVTIRGKVQGEIVTITMADSFIQGDLDIQGSLGVNAMHSTVGGNINGSTNSQYIFDTSIVKGTIYWNGTTSFNATNSNFNTIQMGQSGTVNATLHASTVSGDIDLRQSTAEGSFTITESALQNMFLGDGSKVLHTTNSTYATVESTNLTLWGNNTTFERINVSTVLDLTLENSTISNTTSIYTDTPQVENRLQLTNVTLNTIVLNGTATVNMMYTNAKSISTSTGNDTVRVTGGAVDAINVGAGNDVVYLYDVNVKNLILNTGVEEEDVLTLAGRIGVYQKSLDVRGGTVSFAGSIDFLEESSSATEYTITSKNVALEQGAQLNLGMQGLYSSAHVIADTFVNHSTLPAINIAANIYTGATSSVNLTRVQQYEGNPLLVRLQHKGEIYFTPVNRIENVVVGTEQVVAATYKPYAITAGLLYSLEKNKTNQNNYDFVYKGESPTNNAYATMYNGVLLYNADVWHQINARQQELLQSERDTEGSKAESGNFVENISLWATAKYIYDERETSLMKSYKEQKINVLAGLRFGNVRLSDRWNLNLDIFAGFGRTHSTMRYSEDLVSGITLPNHQNAYTLGSILSFERSNGDRTHTFFSSFGLWYTYADSYLNSNIFEKASTWGTHTINISTSFAYSAFINNIILQPQLSLLYTYAVQHTLKQVNDISLHFQEAQRLVMNSNFTLGYCTPIRLVPYVKLGLDIPLESTGAGVRFSPMRVYKDDVKSLTTNAGVGLAYNKFVQVNFETNFFFGERNGIECALTLGFSF